MNRRSPIRLRYPIRRWSRSPPMAATCDPAGSGGSPHPQRLRRMVFRIRHLSASPLDPSLGDGPRLLCQGRPRECRSPSDTAQRSSKSPNGDSTVGWPGCMRHSRWSSPSPRREYKVTGHTRARFHSSGSRSNRAWWRRWTLLVRSPMFWPRRNGEPLIFSVRGRVASDVIDMQLPLLFSDGSSQPKISTGSTPAGRAVSTASRTRCNDPPRGSAASCRWR